MLTVNIQMPERELEAIVRKFCAAYGNVKFIRLLPVAVDKQHRFAFVQMSTLAETMDLAVAVDGSTLSSGAVALCLNSEATVNRAPGI